jgi:hypothetical protein
MILVESIFSHEREAAVLQSTVVVFGRLLSPYAELGRLFGFTPMTVEFSPALAGILYSLCYSSEEFILNLGDDNKPLQYLRFLAAFQFSF